MDHRGSRLLGTCSEQRKPAGPRRRPLHPTVASPPWGNLAGSIVSSPDTPLWSRTDSAFQPEFQPFHSINQLSGVAAIKSRNQPAMPEYLAPGVYVEETSFRSKSIEGVSTTTTGFIGPCRYGPLDIEPDILTSLADFESVYGDRQKLEFSQGADELDNYL